MEELEIISEYEPTPSKELYSQLMAIENDNEMKDEEKFYLYAKAIAGFELNLEKGLYAIENRISNQKLNNNGERIVSIQTLPHHTGHDHELISPLQPVVWITDGPYGYFNPIDGVIYKNCVGNFDGQAHSILQFLWQCFTSPCFIGFHLIVLLSFVFAIITKYAPGEYYIQHPEIHSLSIRLLIYVPFFYDLIAFLCVALRRIIPYGGQDPIEGSIVQQNTLNFIRSELIELNSEIPPAIRDLLVSSLKLKFGKLGACQCSGQFIIRYFYEPSVSLLKKVVKTVGGVFSPTTVPHLTWAQFEALLIVYRFSREISDSITMLNSDVSAVVLEDNSRFLIRKVIISAFIKGSEDLFKQLFRLLKNACLQPAKRAEIIQQYPRNLSLNHYIGSAAVDLIKKDLEKETIRLKKIADKNGGNPRLDAILDLLQGNKLM